MKKVLILFENETTTENLIEGAIYLKEKMGFTVSGLYINDIRRDGVMTQGIEGAIYDTTRTIMREEFLELRNQEIKNIKKKLKNIDFEMKIKTETGIFNEIVREEMKTNDILYVGKGNLVSDFLLEVLKENYKSVLIQGEKPLDFTNIFIANDNGVKINRSCYQFMNCFPTYKNIKIIEGKNVSEKSSLLEYLTSHSYNCKNEILENKEDVIDVLSKEGLSGVLIMGNLSRSYFLERLTGKIGMKLLKQTPLSIYIG